MFYDGLSAINGNVAALGEYIGPAAIADIPNGLGSSNKDYLENQLFNSDIYLAFNSFLKLRSMFPPPLHTKAIVSKIFEEASETLARRACSGPTQLRIAALKALMFDAGFLNFSNASHILESVDSVSGSERVYSGNSQGVLRIQRPNNFFFNNALGALTASLPVKEERISLLKRELAIQDELRKSAALASLQILPVEELTNNVLQLARSENLKIAQEAAMSLLLCGESKVYLIILSLLNDATHPQHKAFLLRLAATTGREEAWSAIKECANSENALLAEAAISAANIFPIKAEEKIEIYKNAMKRSEPTIACKAAVYAWQNGSMKALRVLEKHLENSSKKNRTEAAKALSQISPEISIPILIKRFDDERSGDVIREIILGLRFILSKNKEISIHAIDYLMPWLGRQLKATDAFKRTQGAVLCGLVGERSTELLLSSLEKESHAYVISAILKALSKCGFDKSIVYSGFLGDEDPRVRASALDSMPVMGNCAQYFAKSLKDENPRVRAAAILKLYMLGQTDVILKANDLVNVPEPASALAGCYALSQTMRIMPNILGDNNPLALAISAKTRYNISNDEYGPIFLNNLNAASIFSEMSLSGGNRKRLTWLLEERNRTSPESYAIRRMLSSMLAIEGEYAKSLDLLDACLSENPGSLADLLDAYRISIRICEMKKAANYGNKLKKLYMTLLLACKHVCTTLPSKAAAVFEKKLDALKEPSMNLYNVMVQLKLLEKDTQGALDLLTEVLLSRPFNSLVAKKLSSLLPETCQELKTSLETYASSLPVTAIGI